jgi:hypothetical protein
MIEVYRVPMSKKQLGALPKDERVLLLLMGQALNLGERELVVCASIA